MRSRYALGLVPIAAFVLVAVACGSSGNGAKGGGAGAGEDGGPFGSTFDSSIGTISTGDGAVTLDG